MDRLISQALWDNGTGWAKDTPKEWGLSPESSQQGTQRLASDQVTCCIPEEARKEV